ncbi:hypothetical protein GMOD_00005190 [Pyrenophora seminiperda CCB06]|uniref:Uncharacterized protein n=1 Tax=Pyrenophora seminiperda CCB06 TaxID=1302712 RepID=A0A3M7LV67_9PLEO|nr:hypothetical protein GMOD_00005190 [Pyrenophora seminiperda CCB06]
MLRTNSAWITMRTVSLDMDRPQFRKVRYAYAFTKPQAEHVYKEHVYASELTIILLPSKTLPTHPSTSPLLQPCAPSLPSVLVSAALAFNTKICKGAGGCVQTAGNTGSFKCPDGSSLNVQQTASNKLDAANGSYEIVDKSVFPTSCLFGQPASGNTLAVHTTEYDQKLYVYIAETCNESKPKQDCYTQNPNPSTITPCQLVDTKKQTCTHTVDNN